jgi:hypothetical protein
VDARGSGDIRSQVSQEDSLGHRGRRTLLRGRRGTQGRRGSWVQCQKWVDKKSFKVKYLRLLSESSGRDRTDRLQTNADIGELHDGVSVDELTKFY